jgi:hypothetical protein
MSQENVMAIPMDVETRSDSVDRTQPRRIFMSIVARFTPTNLTTERYAEANRRLEEAGLWPGPDGLDYHVCFGPEENLRVSEIWDSREQMGTFGQRLMPILADVGIEFSGEPETFEVHNIVRR